MATRVAVNRHSVQNNKALEFGDSRPKGQDRGMTWVCPPPVFWEMRLQAAEEKLLTFFPTQKRGGNLLILKEPEFRLNLRGGKRQGTKDLCRLLPTKPTAFKRQAANV